MLKILVFLLFLLLSGSRQDLLDKLDSEKVNDPNNLKRPCSPQHVLTIFKTNKGGNDTAIQLPAYLEKNNKKLPIALDCLVKINKETASETNTEENSSNQKTSDIHFIKFQDVTSENNRNKAQEEPTVQIDVIEKCKQNPPELEKKDLESGRRFNEPEHSSEYIYNTQSLSTIPNVDLFSTGNQDKIPKEYNQNLAFKHTPYGTYTTKAILDSMNDKRNISTENNKFLDSKEVTSKSTSKYLSSTTIHGKKIPKDILQYLDIGNNGVTKKPSLSKHDLNYTQNMSILSTEADENLLNINVSNKPTTSKYDSSSTLNDDTNRDPFLYKYLDFSNREVSEKPSVVKYNLKSKYKNKLIEMPLQDYKYRIDHDKASSKKDKQSFVPHVDFEKDLVMYHDSTNKAASNHPFPKKYNLNLTSSTAQNVGDKPSTKEFNFTTTPYDDTYEDLYLHSHLGKEKHSNKLFSKSYDQISKPNKIYENLFSSYDPSYTTPFEKEYDPKSILNINDISKENNKLLYNKKVDDKPSTPNDDIYKNLFLYHDLGNKEKHGNSSAKKYDLKSILKFNVSLRPLHEHSYKELNDKLPTEDNEEPYKSYKEMISNLTSIKLPHDLINKESNGTSSAQEEYLRPILEKIKYSNENNLNKENSEKSLYDKNSDTIDPNKVIYKDLYLYHDLSNKKPNDRHSVKTNKQTYLPEDDIYKHLFLIHDLKLPSKEYDPNYKLGKLKISKENNGGLNYKELSDDFTSLKYDLRPTLKEEISKKMFLYPDRGEKEASDNYLTDEHNLNSILKRINFYKDHNGELSNNKAGFKDKDKNYKDIFLYHDFGTTGASDENNKKHHLKSMINNIKFSDNNQQELSYSDERPSYKEYVERYALDVGTLKNHYLNKDISGSKKGSNKKYDLEFKVNNKVLGEDNNEFDNNIIYKHAIQEQNFNKSSNDELQTSIDISEPHLVEPTTGYSIKDLFKARVMLLESTRVCYACSSISDNSCWQPGRSTTVKYCRKGHNACLTKTFKTEESEFIVIRDCGESCDGTWPVLDAKYKSCSICHEDMCNDHLVDVNSGHTHRFFLSFYVSITLIGIIFF